MTKEVQEVPHKFYMNYADAKFDSNYTIHPVDVEGCISPTEATAIVDVSESKIIDYKTYTGDDINLSTGIFKLKTMKRETLFGLFIERVYIFNYYREENDDY